MALRADDVDLDRDRDLVERYQAGDPDAFDDLYRRYFARLRAFCQRRVGDRDAAEELAQEAFVRAYRAMPTFAGERRFYPWVTVIAKRLCIDHHRRHGRIEPLAVIDLGTTEPDLDHLDREVDHGHVRSALAQLAPRHREVLDLREQRGLSYQAIAAELDVPITTVEALLHRARKALRREFQAASREERSIWGLPLVGWLAHRSNALRARIGDRIPDVAAIAAPVGAGAVAAALVVLPADGSDDEPVTAATPTTVTTEGVEAPAAPAAPVEIPGPETDRSPAEPVAPTPSEPPATAPPGVEIVVGDEEGHDRTRAEAEELPESSEVGPAILGTDVGAIVEDVIHAIDNRNTSPGGTP